MGLAKVRRQEAWHTEQAVYRTSPGASGDRRIDRGGDEAPASISTCGCGRRKSADRDEDCRRNVGAALHDLLAVVGDLSANLRHVQVPD